MGKYLNAAHRHAQKIEHFYKHGGPKGYDQAIYHWDQLPALVFNASRSNKEKGDAQIIQEIRKSMEKMMDEMKKRKDDSESE